MFMKCKVTVDTSHYPKNGPWELPEGWCWCSLNDIGKWQSGATPSRGVKAYFGGNIPWLKTGDLNDDYVKDIPERITDKALRETSVKLNPEGSVLIAMYGATIGKVGILTFPATTNQACCACSELSGVENRFLFYFLISYKNEFIRQAGGGAQPNISKEIIVNTPIPVPPAEEQRRIVREIEKWLGLVKIIDKCNLSIQAGIDACKARILDLAIHGKLVPQDATDEPAIELLRHMNPDFKPSDNLHYEGDVPKGWQVCTLNDIFEITMGQSPDGNSLNKTNGVEFHQGKVFFTDKILAESKVFTSSPTKYASPNSMLCCVRAPVGVFNITPRKICIGRGLCALRPRSKEINLDYWFYALSCYKDYYESQATGTTFKAISGDVIRNTGVLLPPQHKQKAILNKIAELFAIIDQISDSID